MSVPVLPKRARVVVVGGGVIGCSVAYHLAHMGWKDVVLLERDRLTSGTTWHAAGLIVTFGSTSETSTEMRKYTRDLYTRLEAETGLGTGFKPVGFIEVAADPDRLEEYRRVSAFNRHCGVDVHEISPSEVKELFPLARTDDLLAGFYVKEDGQANPVDITMALAKGAKMQGATILENVPCTGVLTKRGAVAGVRTPFGDIEAEYVVNCAGMWARQLGARSGVNIPLQSAEHYYLITAKIPDLPKAMPVLEDPGSYGYYREEVGGLMVGLFEPVCAPWKIEGVPDDFSFGEITPDWDRMGPYVEKAMRRVPVTLEVGVRKFFCGPESFTPDLAPVVGEAPEVKNYFVAAGMNSIGILTGGGLGRVLAHWIINGRPDVDVTGMNIDRLHTYQANPEYRRTRTVESLGMVYQCHYPTRSMQTARGAKTAAIHDRLAAAGAHFKDVSGWEGADWYAPPGVAPKVERLSWGRQNWFPYWEAEHKACREGVILMDMSFMAKFLVQGRDAGKLLDHISANRVDGAPGVITYTQWLNEGGTIEADLTVTKLDDERYWVVASDTAHRHVLTWMRRHTRDDMHAFVTDVTSGHAQINIQGPRSRELMQLVTSEDMSNEAFPFRAAREIDIGFARALCVRITYLGELGYELYIPTEQATHVYDRLVEAGKRVDLKHAGLKALASLRMEKGYRDYGHDIDNTDSVLEAGLGFAVDLKKPSFLGREAVLAKKAQGPLKRRIVQVLVKDPEPLMFHAEIVRRNGKPVGYVRAASYGHTLGGAVGLAMVEAGEPIDTSWLEKGTWEVEIAGKVVPAIASIRPLYDPEAKRVKA
ncbi:GcvT family protein [Polyangium spumosum]|uniref:FAD-dependent oxidoreductase n=1 Tax=Polyangium spumosum TaxID=889282 RepID=A0A6N7Q3E2_9BACT|nr:FAD-dependent oxidoreductase [Polyangium spumosum]MRG95421.1 FAD-dependent oxidoreductase [Polyangium spumosum]